MNEKVKTLIESKKQKLHEEKTKQKQKHLIDLGLVDSTKRKRFYVDVPIEGALYDEVEKRYYINKPKPLDVTDDEYEEICKYFPPNESYTNQEVELTTVENTLNTLAYVVLWIGIIGGVIGLFTLTTVEDRYIEEFSPEGLIISLAIILFGVINFAVFKLFVEIAVNIRKKHS
ncbi:MAG TPA: hypothetical protein GXZ87_05735 [Bacteroidales bacterium]|nr:hypothetical protein [Bacteroidales bacterium]